MLTASTSNGNLGHVNAPRSPSRRSSRRRGRTRRAAAPPRTRKRADRYHHGDLQHALLAAAIEHVGRQGVASLSLRAIAEDLGVSRAAPYRHFPSRAALLAEIADAGFRMLTARMRSAMVEAGDDPVARLRAGGIAYVEFAANSPAHYTVMFGPDLVEKSHSAQLAAAAAEAFGVLVDTIRAGQDAGHLRKGDPLALALTAWAGVHGLASLLQSGQIRVIRSPAPRASALASVLADDLIAGIRAPRR